jgi:hypothetical protein
MASFSRSSGRTSEVRYQLSGPSAVETGTVYGIPGLVINESSSGCSSVVSCKPSTSLAYSSCSLEASVFLILCTLSRKIGGITCIYGTYSSIFSPNLTTLLAAESSMGRVRSILRDSMHTLSMIDIQISVRNGCGIGDVRTTHRYYVLHQKRRWRLWTSLLRPVLRPWDRADSGKNR